MTIRNTPESTSLSLKKKLEGNCILSDEEKLKLCYQVFRKDVPSGGGNSVYMPIMKEQTDPENPTQSIVVVDPGFKDITYDKVSSGEGADITGLTVESGATVGEYLLAEYGNDDILNAHPDWGWRGPYEWSDGAEGSFNGSSFTVYDENGANPQTVKGIPFTVTSQEIKDGESKSVTITNSYSVETVNLTAQKRWASPNGSAISWPSGKTVAFQLGKLDESGNFTAIPGISPITLDMKKNADGEDTPGIAHFKNLPEYEVVGGVKSPIRYAVKETAGVEGYEVSYPSAGQDYVAFGKGSAVNIVNRMESKSISVSKIWDKNCIPQGATATFRVYSYTDGMPPRAVGNVNDIVLNGVPDGEGSFGEIIAWILRKWLLTPESKDDGNTVTIGPDATGSFMLCHGQEAVVEGIPSGSTVTVSEDSLGYTAWYKVEGEDYVKGSEAAIQMNGNKHVFFRNDLNVVIDTGVSLNMTPFVALLLLPGVVILWLKMKYFYKE